MSGRGIVAVFVGGPLDGEVRQLEAAVPEYRVPVGPSPPIVFVPGTADVDGDADPRGHDDPIELPPPLRYRRDREPFDVAGDLPTFRYRLEVRS